ncbi:MAG: hypothetical protein QOK24_2557 [Verrucomicrobiota bacterium]|jgi:hypothetical protein
MFRPLLSIILLFLLSSAFAAVPFDLPVQLDQFVELQNFGGESVRLAIHDDGPTSIRVAIGYARPVSFDKARGIDPGTDETLIYSNSRAHLYYVTSPSGKVGYCLLRIRSE